MIFRLVDTGWNGVLIDAMQRDHSAVRLVSPFIKKGAVERLFAKCKPGSLQVITRFDLNGFAQGVSDFAALRMLLAQGAVIRGVKNLHAKLYLFGASRAIVTSANLTTAALVRNHEFGFVAEDQEIVERCRAYFDDLWRKAGPNLTEAKLAKWERTVTKYLASGTCPTVAPGLRDEGTEAGLPAELIPLPVAAADAPQSFVKFFGISSNRAERSLTVLDELHQTGSHRACTYPKGKRPRQVKEGAVLFMGRLVKEPNDILIYGRAIGIPHVPGRDDATPADIALRPWKETWPHYVRVHDGEFIAGTLANGVSLNDLMDQLKSDAFLSTQRNAARKEGNTDPRYAYRQQAAVELSPQAATWMNEQLQRAFVRHGRQPAAALATLDWPRDTPGAEVAE